MKTIRLLTIFIAILMVFLMNNPINCYSQAKNQDTIYSKYGSGFMHHYVYSLNRKTLQRNDLTTILKTNDQAFKVMKSSNNNHLLANTIALPGLLVGTIGELSGNLKIGFIGIGIAVVSIPLYSISNKKMKKAVDIYNSKFRETGYNNSQVEFKGMLTSNGIGVMIYF